MALLNQEKGHSFSILSQNVNDGFSRGMVRALEWGTIEIIINGVVEEES